MRLQIHGITFVLPKDNKQTKADINAKYGKGTHFNLPEKACNKVYEDLQAADKKRKAAKVKEPVIVEEKPVKEASKTPKKKTKRSNRK